MREIPRLWSCEPAKPVKTILHIQASSLHIHLTQQIRSQLMLSHNVIIISRMLFISSWSGRIIQAYLCDYKSFSSCFWRDLYTFYLYTACEIESIRFWTEFIAGYKMIFWCGPHCFLPLFSLHVPAVLLGITLILSTFCVSAVRTRIDLISGTLTRPIMELQCFWWSIHSTIQLGNSARQLLVHTLRHWKELADSPPL